MQIFTYPNPILTQVSEPVTEFDAFGEHELEDFCNDLHDIMSKNDGVGLSAVQVGILKRIIVMQCPDKSGNFGHKFTFINPEIVDRSKDKFSFSEGCLSVPGYYENRARFKTILLKYQDDFGDSYQRPFSDLASFCIQHELDHLEGKLFIDDLSPLKKERVRKKIQKTLKRR